MAAAALALRPLESCDEIPGVCEPKGEVDLPRIEAAVREILIAVGEDPEREGLQETPRRVAKAYRDLFAGLRQRPVEHLGRVFAHETNGEDLVMVRDIEFFSLCEHHLLPFYGTAQVAYLPSGGRVVGLSKIARTVDVFARRPQMQERLTAQVADALVEHLGSRAVAVIVQAEHMCMKMRGANKHRSDMVTTAFRGMFERSESLRAQLRDLSRPRQSWILRGTRGARIRQYRHESLLVVAERRSMARGFEPAVAASNPDGLQR